MSALFLRKKATKLGKCDKTFRLESILEDIFLYLGEYAYR